MKYIIVIPNYWGTGSTLAEAKKNCERTSCKRILKRTPRIFAMTDDEGAYVDEVDGTIYHKKGALFEVIERYPTKEKEQDV
jgi:hypothetical protein